MARPDDTHGPAWPRCPHGKQMTTEGCRDCLREASLLAAAQKR